MGSCSGGFHLRGYDGYGVNSQFTKLDSNLIPNSTQHLPFFLSHTDCLPNRGCAFGWRGLHDASTLDIFHGPSTHRVSQSLINLSQSSEFYRYIFRSQSSSHKHPSIRFIPFPIPISIASSVSPLKPISLTDVVMWFRVQESLYQF